MNAAATGGTSSGGSRDATRADLLNAPTDKSPVQPGEPVARWRIKSYMIQQGLLLAILGDKTHPSALMAAALFSDPDFQYIDTTDPGFQGVVGALEADKLVSADQVAAVMAMGGRPGSPAEGEFGPGAIVTVNDVSAALRGK